MRIAVTGTPGTGKTAATRVLAAPDSGPAVDLSVIHLNEIIKQNDLWLERDESRDTVVADIEAIEGYLEGETGIFESHLAHRLDVDRAVVLRCRPDLLEKRLLDRGEPAETALENRQSEALDVILGETVGRHGRELVHEIETTTRSPVEVAEEIARVIRGERDPSVGEVDYLEYA